MGVHPIENLMTTAMNSIRDMVDVNTIIGDPIETTNNIIIIPISKVAFGFAAGGSEFRGETLDEYKRKDKEEEAQYRLPFGGGSGAGVSINPIAFLVVSSENVRVIPVNYTSAVDKLIEYVPDLMEKANTILSKAMNKKCKDGCNNTNNVNNEKFDDSIKNKPEDIEVEYDDTGNASETNYIEDDE